MKLYMFRTVRLSIISSLFTVHSAMVYVIRVCRQLSSRSICSCSKAVYKPVWHTSIPLLSVQWINSWCWTEELFETCRVSCQNKLGKLVHLVGFITNKVFSNYWERIFFWVRCCDRVHSTSRSQVQLFILVRLVWLGCLVFLFRF